MTKELASYINELNQQYKTGIAREHSYRPALKNLLQSLLPKMVVTNEPAHFECGAPDYIIQREKDLKNQVLTFDDIIHYQRIIYVLQQTIGIMSEIDNIIYKQQYAGQQ